MTDPQTPKLKHLLKVQGTMSCPKTSRQAPWSFSGVTSIKTSKAWQGKRIIVWEPTDVESGAIMKISGVHSGFRRPLACATCALLNIARSARITSFWAFWRFIKWSGKVIMCQNKTKCETDLLSFSVPGLEWSLSQMLQCSGALLHGEI